MHVHANLTVLMMAANFKNLFAWHYYEFIFLFVLVGILDT